MKTEEFHFLTQPQQCFNQNIYLLSNKFLVVHFLCLACWSEANCEVIFHCSIVHKVQLEELTYNGKWIKISMLSMRIQASSHFIWHFIQYKGLNLLVPVCRDLALCSASSNLEVIDSWFSWSFLQRQKEGAESQGQRYWVSKFVHTLW